MVASHAATPGAEPLFQDRHEAGGRLAAELHRFRGQQPVVIGLPHGGVPVAYEVARALDAPLDAGLIDRRAFEGLGVTELEIRAAARREAYELGHAVRAFHGGGEPISVRGRTVLVVDDGLATGSTAFAAAQALRKRGAARVVLAVPVGPPGTSERLEGAFDEVVCLHEPEPFLAVGSCYQDFTQTCGEQVQALLSAHGEGRTGAPPAQSGAGRRGAREPRARGRLRCRHAADRSKVTAPTLLIVGGDDRNVLALNEDASNELRCPNELAIVPHAGHLFEAPGALKRVTELAAEWFRAHLTHAAGHDAA